MVIRVMTPAGVYKFTSGMPLAQPHSRIGGPITVLDAAPPLNKASVPEASGGDTGMAYPEDAKVYLFDCSISPNGLKAEAKHGVGLGLYVVAEFLPGERFKSKAAAHPLAEGSTFHLHATSVRVISR